MSAEDDALSDLTDLDELSEEFEDSSKKKKGKGRGKSGEYLIRHSLKTPRATTYSTESLFKQIDNGDIDLEPEYQRDVVWPESKQIKIIDSIFRNYYVPPVIFALNINDDGTETRTCIDGKQRLTSIHRFMQGLIPHRDPDTNDKYWYTDNPLNRTAKTKTMLPDKYRRLWDTKAVVCVEYSDLKEADEREIFTRVQLGVALTPAEKLKVIATPRANFVRKLQELYLNNDESALSGGSLNWNRSRGSDFRCLAQMLQWIESSAKTSSFINIEKWLSDSVAVGPQFTSAVENTFAIYEALASQEDWVLKKIAPIEFIAIGLILYEFRDRMSVAGLAKCVDSMRKDLRKITSDIRNNSRMQKAVMTFMEKFKVPALTRGEVCAEDAIKTSGLKVKKTAGVKRKAPVDDEEEDSEEEYVPAKKAKAAKTAPTTKTTTKAKAAPSPKKRAPANAEPAKAAAASAPVAAAPPPTPPATASPPAITSAPAVAAASADDDILAMAKRRIEAARANARVQSATAAPSHGAEGIAAALNLENLEAGLMGTQIKTEPNVPPLSSASSNGRYYDRDRDRDRDRNRDRDRDRRDDYGSRYNGRRY